MLFHSSQPCIRYSLSQPCRDSDTFDGTMGAYNGAEICELVGIFMLLLLSKKYSFNNIGSYCDDTLSVFRNICGQKAEKHKKQCKKFSKTKAYKQS